MLVHSALHAAREARHVDTETGLPNARSFRELARATPRGSAIVIRVANFGDVASVLGRAHAAELLTLVAHRLVFAADSAIHRIDDGALGWINSTTDDDEEAERLDAAVAMLRPAFEIHGRQVELHFGFGVAAITGSTEAGPISTGSISTGPISTGATNTPADAPARASSAADTALARGLRWAHFTADLEQQSEWRLGLAAELDQAMAQGISGLPINPSSPSPADRSPLPRRWSAGAIRHAARCLPMPSFLRSKKTGASPISRCSFSNRRSSIARPGPPWVSNWMWRSIFRRCCQPIRPSCGGWKPCSTAMPGLFPT
jgi:GGDEF domain-containing protein